MKQAVVFLSMLFLSGAVFAEEAVEKESMEHAWLYVEGRYIRTSAYAKEPNAIFTGAGLCIPTFATGKPEDMVKWCKERNCNVIRLGFNCLPKPLSYGEVYDRWGYKDFQDFLDNYITVYVREMRKQKIYMIIDQHGFFHNYKKTDNWFPTGKVWGEEEIDIWIGQWKAMAERFKDEPYVVGYELMNEPCSVDAKYIRDAYIKCIREIRKIDTRHIVFLANNSFAHSRNMIEVWGKINFRPDEPYNQVAYVFHEYPNAENPEIVEPMLMHVMKCYRVPVFCTEFGADDVVKGLSEETKRKFQKDMYAMFKRSGIGSTIWKLRGNYPNFNGPKYFDIWEPEVKILASPVPEKGEVEPEPARLYCGAQEKRLKLNDEYIISAIVVDEVGCRLPGADVEVEFKLEDKKGIASLEGDNPAKAVDGIATIMVKTGRKKGKFTITASSGKLQESSLKLAVKK